MKSIQYNDVNPSVTVDSAKSGAAVDVGGMGPLTIAVQLVLTDAATPGSITATLQGSLDGVTYFNVGSAVALTANGTVGLAATSVEYKFYRVTYARTSGSIVAAARFLVYGDRV